MLNKLLAAIRGLTDTAPLAEADRVVAQAHAEHAEAERRLEAARVAYTASLTADDDKAAIAAHVEVDRRKVLLDRAAAAIDLAEKARAEAAERDAEAERRSRYADAQAKIRMAQKALEAYPEYARAIRDILAVVAQANVATVAANGDLPVGAKALRPAEMQVRGLPGVPPRELSRERLPDEWCFAGEHEIWGALLPQSVPSVKTTGDRTGVIEMIHPETKRYSEFAVELRPAGTRVVVMPEKAGVMPEALHTQIALPGLRAGDPAIWAPVGNLNWGYPTGEDGPAVLEAIAAREALPIRTLEEMQPDGAPQERIERPAPRAAGAPNAAAAA